jgi:hypothetical protein
MGEGAARTQPRQALAVSQAAHSACCPLQAHPRRRCPPQIQAANPVSRSLFNTAYRYKQAALAAGDLSGGRLGPFWDRLVFSKIKARVGGEAGVGGSAQGVRWRAIMRSYLHLLPGAHEIGGPACG